MNFQADVTNACVCGQPCNEDKRVIHACGQVPSQWCQHLGFHLRIAMGRQSCCVEEYMAPCAFPACGQPSWTPPDYQYHVARYGHDYVQPTTEASASAPQPIEDPNAGQS